MIISLLNYHSVKLIIPSLKNHKSYHINRFTHNHVPFLLTLLDSQAVSCIEPFLVRKVDISILLLTLKPQMFNSYI